MTKKRELSAFVPSSCIAFKKIKANWHYSSYYSVVQLREGALSRPKDASSNSHIAFSVFSLFLSFSALSVSLSSLADSTLFRKNKRQENISSCVCPKICCKAEQKAPNLFSWREFLREMGINHDQSGGKLGLRTASPSLKAPSVNYIS